MKRNPTREDLGHLPSPTVFGWALLGLAPMLGATGQGFYAILLSFPLAVALATAHWLWKTATFPEQYENETENREGST